MSSLFEVDGGLTPKLRHGVFKLFTEPTLLEGIETEQYLVTKVNNLIKLSKDSMGSHLILYKKAKEDFHLKIFANENNHTQLESWINKHHKSGKEIGSKLIVWVPRINTEFGTTAIKNLQGKS